MNLNRDATCIWPLAATLGEGPLWREVEQSLYFVDIKKQRLHRLCLPDGTRHTWPLPEMLCWIIPCLHAPGLVAGLQSGIAYIEPRLAADGPGELHLSWLQRLHDPSSTLRLNDAKADAHGSIWFGTMDNLERDTRAGCLYRLDASGQITCVDRGYHVSNGPAFSPDGRTLYHTDSARRSVYAFDLDGTGWPLAGSRRLWLQFDASQGYPDGMTVDSEGAIWIAHWDGACVTRWSAQAQLLETVPLAAVRPTSMAFGGPDYRSLLITSASVEGATDPQQGGVWHHRAGVAGMPPCAWGGSADLLAAHRPQD
ncbi:MAG: hypothetical protein RL748_4153 [Pseudomonadota bacterium]